MKTDTPRTDLYENTTRNPHYDPEEAEQLAWEVARTFERELFGASERLAKLEAELNELREDKARLDWLGTQCGAWMQRGGRSGLKYEVRCDGEQTVRQAIDAAKGGER